MDEIVLRALARWPGVPEVYDWLALDRRGEWRLKNPAGGEFERIGNRALRDFIGRNYAADARGCWYFQNGPQRVFVRLAYTPLVVHLEDGALIDHCGQCFGEPTGTWLDEEGSIVLAGARGAGLLDDRDLASYVEALRRPFDEFQRIACRDVAARFGFVPDPAREACEGSRTCLDASPKNSL
jgi:hypothetical protein